MQYRLNVDSYSGSLKVAWRMTGSNGPFRSGFFFGNSFLCCKIWNTNVPIFKSVADVKSDLI